MPSGDIKTTYVEDSVLTVTNLHSLPSSATYIAGWESPTIDHSADGADDDTIGLHFITHASNRQVGAIRIYGVIKVNDSVWPDTFDGTESLETWGSVERRDAGTILAREIAVSATASEPYSPTIPSMKAVFGTLPKTYALYITGNATTGTTAQLAAAGSTITVRTTFKNVVP